MLTALLASISIGIPGIADPGLLIRVVDTGPGLFCIIRIPDKPRDRFVIYDAGNRQRAAAVLKARLEEMIPAGSTIDLLVLSHSDADHVGIVPEICARYFVKRVIRPGVSGGSATWQKAVAAIKAEKGCDDINLAEDEVPTGKRFVVGGAMLRFICGFSKPPSAWNLQDESERKNAGSVIIRLIYKGRSVLFTGDAVGRHNGDPDPYTCIATEQFAINKSAQVPIRSKVLIAPHHGADNGSSMPFIAAVDPEYVEFSAGHEYEHPRASTAKRYRDFGIPVSKMFRTDWGDDEGPVEWARGRIAGAKDRPGDDDVDILLKSSSAVSVRYRQPRYR